MHLCGALGEMPSSSMFLHLNPTICSNRSDVAQCFFAQKPLVGDASAVNVGRVSVDSRSQGRPLRFLPRGRMNASGLVVACCCFTRIVAKKRLSSTLERCRCRLL
jgi:hypothetical protein